MSHLSLQTSKPVYYIVDCRIFRMLASFPRLKDELTHFFFFSFYVDKQEVSFKIDKNISYNSAIWSNSILAIWCQIYLFLALHYITFRRSKNIALFQLSVLCPNIYRVSRIEMSFLNWLWGVEGPIILLNCCA